MKPFPSFVLYIHNNSQSPFLFHHLLIQSNFKNKFYCQALGPGHVFVKVQVQIQVRFSSRSRSCLSEGPGQGSSLKQTQKWCFRAKNRDLERHYHQMCHCHPPPPQKRLPCPNSNIQCPYSWIKCPISSCYLTLESEACVSELSCVLHTCVWVQQWSAVPGRS